MRSRDAAFKFKFLDAGAGELDSTTSSAGSESCQDKAASYSESNCSDPARRSPGQLRCTWLPDLEPILVPDG